jgi:hypothetical protein
MSAPLSERNQQLCVRIDAVTRRRLVAEAERDRRPIASLARLLIEDALADRDRERGREGDRAAS